MVGLFLVHGCNDKPEISDISGIYRERKYNSDGPDAPLSRFDVKDQSDDHWSKTFSGSFSCCRPETRGERVSWVYFCVYVCAPWHTGRKVSVHPRDKFNGQRSSVTHTAQQSEEERKSLDRHRKWVETIRPRWETSGWMDRWGRGNRPDPQLTVTSLILQLLCSKQQSKFPYLRR